MPIRLDILELEKIKNNGKIDRTFDWFRKEQNMQPAYYLLKLRANSLTSPKNWEVGLKGRMTPASSIPLQSKDTALFQRDLNSKKLFKPACSPSKDTALFQRDLNLN